MAAYRLYAKISLTLICNAWVGLNEEAILVIKEISIEHSLKIGKKSHCKSSQSVYPSLNIKLKFSRNCKLDNFFVVKKKKLTSIFYKQHEDKYGKCFFLTLPKVNVGTNLK